MPCQPFCSSRNTTEGVAKNAASCWAFQQTEHPLAGGPKRTGLPQKFACERVCWYSVSVWLFLFDWDFGGYQGQDWTSSYSSYGVWKWGKKKPRNHWPPVTPVMVSESGEKKPKKPLIIIFPIDMAIKVGCFIDVHRFIISNPPKKTTMASQRPRSGWGPPLAPLPQWLGWYWKSTSPACSRSFLQRNSVDTEKTTHSFW